MPSVAHLISDYGYIIIFGFIFIETALLVGFFLPGDSLLIIAGYYAATGQLNLFLIFLIASIAAIVGDSVAYSIGRRGGRRLFKKEESLFFSSNHLKRAEVFFEKHGPITVLIARPIAFLRTFAPVVAGIGQMEYRKFITYNIVGGVVWVLVFTTFGWIIGSFLKDVLDPEVVSKIIDMVTIGIVVVSLGSFISLAIYKKLTLGESRGIKYLRKILRRK